MWEEDWSGPPRGWDSEARGDGRRASARGRVAAAPRSHRHASGPSREQSRERYLGRLAADLASGTLPVAEIVRTILRLGREGYFAAWVQVAPFLEHPDAGVRRAALQVLVSEWKMDQYREVCERLCEGDQDSDVRRFASTCLGILYQSTNDRRTLKRLAGIAKREDEGARVRGAAFVSILRVLGKKGRDIPFIGNADDLAARVDWNLVEACATERWDEVPFAPPA